MKKNFSILFIVILLIVVAAAGTRLLKKRRQAIVNAPLATPISHRVNTIKPETRTIIRTKTFLARLETVNSAQIASKFSGRINELLVSESQKVGKGDLLVRIDHRDISADIAGLDAQLVSAKRAHETVDSLHKRNQTLFKAGGLAKEKLDASAVDLGALSARVTEFEQKIKGLESQLDYFSIRAFFDGVVGTIFLRAGDLAVPGRPILTLHSFTQKLVFNSTPGTDGIVIGQQILIKGSKAGRIARLYEDAINGLTTAEVSLDKRIDLPAGSYLTMEVITGTATGCAVPVQALLHGKKGTSIMVYQKDHFEQKNVRVKIQDKNFALILPCVNQVVALASEAKLSLLPFQGSISVIAEEKNE